MHPLRSVLIFLVVVFLGGALVAPAAYLLVQAAMPGSWLAQHPFHRYMNRAFLGLALISIWPLLRGLGATSWRELGLVSGGGRTGFIDWRRLGAGFVLGMISLACVAILAVGMHGRQLNPDLTLARLTGGVAGAAGTAIIVAVIEEVLFRGALFGGLRRFWDWRAALLLSSMAYAIMHFMENVRAEGPVTWTSGLEFLPRMLRGFGDWQVVIPGFFNLTLAGILLGLAYQRTGNLYFSIGLHAGWIFWRVSYGLLTVPVVAANAWFWGTQKLTDGWLALGILALTLMVMSLMLPPRMVEKPS